MFVKRPGTNRTHCINTATTADKPCDGFSLFGTFDPEDDAARVSEQGHLLLGVAERKTVAHTEQAKASGVDQKPRLVGRNGHRKMPKPWLVLIDPSRWWMWTVVQAASKVSASITASLDGALLIASSQPHCARRLTGRSRQRCGGRLRLVASLGWESPSDQPADRAGHADHCPP
ncbi:MAG: hypothetical protein JNN21_10545 [Candidatus Accumulibacter sp.]|nr:hypothetical protein [Accumulibacter sp.]